jgi:hypothetical protein
MGLTGVILSAAFKLIPIETVFIRQETHRASNLQEAMERFEDSQHWTYSVAWIDCLAGGNNLGRSLVYLGEHARRDELPTTLNAGLNAVHRTSRRVPFNFPSFALNRWTVGAFNELYYRGSRPGVNFVDYDTYFYPLDSSNINACCLKQPAPQE